MNIIMLLALPLLVSNPQVEVKKVESGISATVTFTSSARSSRGRVEKVVIWKDPLEPHYFILPGEKLPTQDAVAVLFFVDNLRIPWNCVAHDGAIACERVGSVLRAMMVATRIRIRTPVTEFELSPTEVKYAVESMHAAAHKAFEATYRR